MRKCEVERERERENEESEERERNKYKLVSKWSLEKNSFLAKFDHEAFFSLTFSLSLSLFLPTWKFFY